MESKTWKTISCLNGGEYTIKSSNYPESDFRVCVTVDTFAWINRYVVRYAGKSDMCYPKHMTSFDLEKVGYSDFEISVVRFAAGAELASASTQAGILEEASSELQKPMWRALGRLIVAEIVHRIHLTQPDFLTEYVSSKEAVAKTLARKENDS